MPETHQIIHMASFSRSGETLMLRCLNAHPSIHVVHQILEPDQSPDIALFRYLMKHSALDVSSQESTVKDAKVPKGSTILLKNAVWTHPHSFRGFVLVRNPFSVINSFKITREREEKTVERKKQLRRWAKMIDPQLLPAVSHSDNIAAVCMLYNRKMAPLLRLGLPIVRYEDFVASPDTILPKLLDRLGIPQNQAVLKSHENYAPESYGHGHIPLWQPIHNRSTDSWKRLAPRIISSVYGITWPVMRDYGYDLVDGELILRDDVEGLVK